MSSFIAEGYTYLALSFLIIAFRLFVRTRNGQEYNGLRKDDYIMALVLLPLTAETILAYFVEASAKGLTNSGMTDAERAALETGSEEWNWRVTGSKIQVAGWPMYVTVLWGIKASICCFFSRLAQGVHGYRIVLWIGYIFIGSSYVVLILAMLLSCQPGYKMWQIYPDPGNICQPAVSKVSIFMVLILNITTDIYLLVLPLKLLWGIKLPPIKKAGVVVLFSGAIFIIVAGILRCVFILSSGTDGPQAGASWAVRESFVAIITSNIPILYGYIRRKLRPYLGSLLTSTNTGHKLPGGPGIGSVKLQEGTDYRSRQSTGRTTMQNDTFLHTSPTESEDDVSLREILSGKHDGIGMVTEVSRHVSNTPYDGDQAGIGIITTVAASDGHAQDWSRPRAL